MNQKLINVSRAQFIATLIFIPLMILAWFVTDPVGQPSRYNQFIDQREMFGLPNGLNLLSNIAFLVVGIWGLVSVKNKFGAGNRVKNIYAVFFMGIFAVSFGSSLYHWSPNNMTLVWDRLPITVAFMAFTALIVFERCSESLGYRLFPWLIALGIASVIYWSRVDDLRPYLIVQFGPMLILPWVIWRFDGPGTRWLWLTIALYVVAKIFELSDEWVFQMTESIVSGHTLKHLAAALGAFCVLVKMQKPQQ